MAKSKSGTKNIVLAILIGMTIVMSLIGTTLVNTAEGPRDVTVGQAKVLVNVAQSPVRPTAHVTVTVLPRIG